MSINMFLRTVVWLTTFASLSLMADDASIIQQLSRRYQGTKTELERRSICLEALDRGVIKVDGPIANVKAIFGTDFSENVGKDSNGMSYGIVHFVQIVKAGPDVSALSVGWYFMVYYSGGVIYNYYLTDVHK